MNRKREDSERERGKGGKLEVLLAWVVWV